jgi:hypothetical protein
LHVVAQPLGVTALAHLAAHPRQEFVLVDRAEQKIVHADFQPAHHARIVVGLGDHQDRNIPRALERAQLAA